jgi:cytochrome c5
MSAPHSSDSDSPSSASAVKGAVYVFVGAIAMVIGIILLAYYAIGTRTLGSSNDNVMSAEGIASRIAPQTTIAVDTTKGPVPALSAAVATPAPAAAGTAAPIVAAVIPAAADSSAKPAGGEAIYKASCSACHVAGVAGAPKSGDKAAWAPRLAQGKDTLYKHAIQGFQGKGGVMPAKGGNTSLSDADVKAAVDYMMVVNK